MDTLQIAANPFALMMDPASVIAAMERSDRLATLKSRICRPLDKPLVARTPDALADFDAAIDAAGGDFAA
jgi:hypothetical protein